jgi:hypothetical protein
MASASLEQIEKEFAELSPELQLNLLERLVRHVRIQNGGDDQAFAAGVAEMAKDPDIQRELRAIDAEFRHTEGDGLGNT